MADKVPGEIREVLQIDVNEPVWTVPFDGSSTTAGGGVDALLT
jgi:hypothetical protein